jgi:hypothetical protein
MKSAALIRQLEAAGSRLDRVRGSHQVFRHPERPGAMAAAEEAASAWIDAALDAGEPVPRPLLSRLSATTATIRAGVLR